MQFNRMSLISSHYDLFYAIREVPHPGPLPTISATQSQLSTPGKGLPQAILHIPPPDLISDELQVMPPIDNQARITWPHPTNTTPPLLHYTHTFPRIAPASNGMVIACPGLNLAGVAQ